ncbi:MAG: YfhO family protein [Planctomycetes bacterium]|nr:YfhO family protein [Planctomycetota bacterium]
MQEGGLLARFARGLRFHGLAMAILFLVAAAPFVAPALRGETPFFLDLADHWYPFRLHAWEARQQGELAHWCRHSFCGFPFLPQLEAAIAYPPHWVLDTFHPSKTLLPQVVGHRFVLGALLYAVIRARGLSRTAGVLGGALLIASGITMTCFTQMAVLRTLAWIPLVFLGATRIAKGRGLEGMLWTALGCGLAFVAGYAPFLQRAAVALPFLYVADPSWPRGAVEWRERAVRFVWAGLGAALGVAMASAQIVPSMALTAVSQRQLGLDPELLDSMRVEPLHALMMLAPRVASGEGIGRQGFAYLGVLPLALCALAVLRRRPGATAFALAAAAALVASMGRAVPVVGDLFASIPVVSSFRNPGQYLVAWIIVVPVLAAIGLDAWRERKPSAREAAITLGGVAALMIVAALVPHPIADRGSLLRAGVGCAALAAGVVALFLPGRIALLALVAASIVDAASFQFNFATKDGRTRPVEALLVPDEPFAIVARRHRETGREGVPRAITSEAVFNWENHGWVAGVDDVRGLISLLPMRALDLNRIVAEGEAFPRVPPKEPLYGYGPVHALDAPRIDLLAVQYAIGFRGQPGPEWRAVAPDIWERDAAPEARLAERVTVADPQASVPSWSYLAAPGFDARRDVVVESPPFAAASRIPAGGADPGGVRMTSVGANEVRMSVDATLETLLVWAETFDDGWSATVDGAAVRVRRANWAHMAVDAGPGHHEVVWRYVSPGWRLGVGVSLAALAVFLALTCVCARRRVNR